MLRTIYGDKPRYKKQYWSDYKGKYLTGDGARRDKDGYFWIVGRIDDVQGRQDAHGTSPRSAISDSSGGPWTPPSLRTLQMWTEMSSNSATGSTTQCRT